MKPIVHYQWAHDVELGESAIIVHVPDHPLGLRGDCVYTSPVVRIGEAGEFETVNTIYRKLRVQ